MHEKFRTGVRNPPKRSAFFTLLNIDLTEPHTFKKSYLKGSLNKELFSKFA